MEKVDKLCKIRNLYRSIIEFENWLIKEHFVSLNEGILLCLLNQKASLTSSQIALELELTCSNTSKVIKSLEKKKLIKRRLGKADKRQIILSISNEGNNKIEAIKKGNLEIPHLLQKTIE